MIDNPVFIVGMPRSGTTVFSKLFSKSTGVLICPETHFLREPYKRYAQLDLSLEKNVNLVLDSYTKSRWFQSLGLNLDEIISSLEKQKETSWPILFRTIIELHAKKSGATSFGEKTPGHYKNVQELLTWFPNCKIIFVFRNPIDVIASNLCAPFASSSVILNALRYKEVFQSYDEYRQDKRLVLVKYEDFVKSSKQIINSIVKTNSSDQEFIYDNYKINEGWRNMHLSKASEPINSRSIGKGEILLNNYEKWVIEYILSKEMKSMNYSKKNRNYNPISFPLKIIFHWCRDRFNAKIRSSFLNVEDGYSITRAERILVRLTPWFERISYVVFKYRFLTKKIFNSSNYDCLICINQDVPCQSSYQRLHLNAEDIGLDLMKLIEKNQKIAISVKDYKSFLVARNILKSFWLRNRVNLVFKRK